MTDPNRASGEAMPAIYFRSRFIRQADMSAQQLMDCSYQAQAIISLCRFVGDNLPSDERAVPLGSHIDQALALAFELVGIMHDALEGLEDLKGGDA